MYEPDNAKHAFSNEEEAITKYNLQDVSLYEPVRLLRANGDLLTTTVGRIIFNPHQKRRVLWFSEKRT